MNKFLQTLADFFQRFFKLGDYSSNRLLGAARSSGWRDFREQNIKESCESCGVKGTLLKPLELHHCESFATNPAKELDPLNVITLCHYCHLTLAHFRNYKSLNENIREDAATLLFRIQNRPTWNGMKWVYPIPIEIIPRGRFLEELPK